jgi:hypothetical protein
MAEEKKAKITWPIFQKAESVKRPKYINKPKIKRPNSQIGAKRLVRARFGALWPFGRFFAFTLKK